jgi:potassium efflux system protein
VLWIAFAAYLSEALDALRMLRDAATALADMSLHAPLLVQQGRSYTGVDLLQLPALLLAVWIAATLLVRLLDTQVLAPIGVERGLRDATSVLLRIGVGAVGALIVLQAYGVDLRTLALAASVLGVGIGFGLQNIANNFVSGLLINIELPVRAGDFVRVGEWEGTVIRVGGRSTEIRTLDEVAILVPNARFLESEVVNWSHGSPLSRVHVPVAVAYGSNVSLVRRVLLDAAGAHPAVRRDPRPQVQLVAFGESALELELLVWTCDPRNQRTLVSDLNFRVLAQFARHGIEVPFPQHDVHLRSPQLDRVLGAVARRVAPEDAVPAAETDVAPVPVDDPDLEPAGRSDAELDAIADRLRGPTGVPIRDRRRLLARHPRCFVGGEAVAWLMQREGLTRGEAIAVGRDLVERGVIHHVLDEHDFRDGPFFYRFRADEEGDRLR